MKRVVIIVIGALLVVLIGGGVLLYQWGVFEDSAAPSGPISAVPLAQEPAGAAAGSLLFQIVPDQSQVRFTLSEVLRGKPNEVVGTSKQVAGEIAVTPNDLSATKVGVIRIDARTLTTDDSRRNRTINNFILDTRTYEYITFTPTEIKGLQGAAEQGKPLKFQIVGDLTIRDVTRPVVFEISAKADSPTQLSGTATTTINRADYKLNIPSVPFVASVGEQVKLDIDFVAVAKS
ncbi:MAG: YceI family protein [Roseiflexaceae bacterium]